MEKANKDQVYYCPICWSKLAGGKCPKHGPMNFGLDRHPLEGV